MPPLTEKQSAALHLLIDVPPDRVVLRPVYPAARARPVAAGPFNAEVAGVGVPGAPGGGAGCNLDGRGVWLHNYLTGVGLTTVVVSDVISRPFILAAAWFASGGSFDLGNQLCRLLWSQDNSPAGGQATSGRPLEIGVTVDFNPFLTSHPQTFYPMIRIGNVPGYFKWVHRNNAAGAASSHAGLSLIYT